MACCTVANCGDNVVINTCCDTDTDNGLASPNGLIFNVVADCDTQGNLIITWETKSPNEIVVVTVDGEPIPVVDNSATIPNWDGIGDIVIGVDGSDTEIVNVTHDACELIPVQPVLLLSECYNSGTEILLTWNNPESILVNLYRANDDLLLVGPSSALTQYYDVLPLSGVNNYELRRDDTSEVIASTSINFDNCAIPPVGVCNPTYWHDWRDVTVGSVGDDIQWIPYDQTASIKNLLQWTITGLPEGYECAGNMRYQTYTDVVGLVYTVSSSPNATLVSVVVTGTTALVTLEIINGANNSVYGGVRGIRPIALKLGLLE